MRVGLLSCALVLCTVSLSLADPAHASARKDTNIPAEGLSVALQAFAKDFDLQVLYHTEIAAGLKTQGAIGSLTPDEAMTKVLVDTGLSYKFLDASTITVFPATALSAQSSPPSTTQEGQNNSNSFRLAQNNQTVAGPQIADQKKPSEPELTEIVVTGTHIRGVAPIGSSLITYDRSDIDRSGAGTVDQFMRTLPENFASVDSSTNVALGVNGIGEAAQNSAFGSAVNIHGLGLSGTLTLLNGHRLAPTGSGGNVIDVSVIPMAAIDRVEVLTDGASAIYGSDAVAGVVNFVLKKDFEGAQTSARYGDTTDGGASEWNVSQLFGHAWSSGNGLVAYQHDDRSPLFASQRSFVPTSADGLGPTTTLIPGQHDDNVFAALNQTLAPNLTLSADGLYSMRRYSLGSDLFEDPSTTTGRSDQLGGTLDLIYSFAESWSAELTGTYFSHTDNSRTADNFSDEIANVHTTAATVTAQIQGTLLSLPGGDVKAVLGSTGEFDSIDRTLTVISPPIPEAPFKANRSESSVFTEVAVPIIGSANATWWAHSLQLSFAGRFDHYSDFGSTTNPKVGASWVPVSAIAVRATYGSSFRAPYLSQLDSSPELAYVLDLVDPKSATGMSETLIRDAAGNPHLQPETSHSFTVGFDVTPESLRGFKASATYFHINYTNRIAQPPAGALTGVLVDPDLSAFANRSPSPAQVQQLLTAAANSGQLYNLAGLPEPINPNSINVIFDDRVQNIASTNASGVDLSSKYAAETGIGSIFGSVAGTYLMRLRLTDTPTSEPIDAVNTLYNPPRLRLHSVLGWSRNIFASSLTLNFTSAYQNLNTVPTSTVSSWTTLDWQGALTLDDNAPALLRGSALTLTVLNLANREPPRVIDPMAVAGFGYDPANASPIGRFISLQLTKKW